MKRVLRAFIISACATAAAGLVMTYLKDSKENADTESTSKSAKLKAMVAEQEEALLTELESYV